MLLGTTDISARLVVSEMCRQSCEALPGVALCRERSLLQARKLGSLSSHVLPLGCDAKADAEAFQDLDLEPAVQLAMGKARGHEVKSRKAFQGCSHSQENLCLTSADVVKHQNDFWKLFPSDGKKAVAQDRRVSATSTPA